MVGQQSILVKSHGRDLMIYASWRDSQKILEHKNMLLLGVFKLRDQRRISLHGMGDVLAFFAVEFWINYKLLFYVPLNWIILLM